MTSQPNTVRQNVNSHYEKSYEPFGFYLKVVTNSAAVITAADMSFGRFPTSTEKSSPDITFLLTETDPLSKGLPSTKFRLVGHMAYQTMEEFASMTVDCERGFVEAQISQSVIDNQPFFRWHFLELAFFLMMPTRGFMGTHGAALVKGDTAVILRAQSGGGKTTLTYAGARSKYQALAEDVVWIDQHQQLCWGMPWSFHLLPDAKALFPELAPYEPVLQTNQEMKLEVNLETIRPGCTTTSAKIGPVVLLERQPGTFSHLQPVELPEAKQLWLAGAAGNEMDFPDYDIYIDQLLENNAYRLYFGDDIDAAVNLLDPLFI